jgi:hypothetical protein
MPRIEPGPTWLLRTNWNTDLGAIRSRSAASRSVARSARSGPTSIRLPSPLRPRTATVPAR